MCGYDPFEYLDYELERRDREWEAQEHGYASWADYEADMAAHHADDMLHDIDED